MNPLRRQLPVRSPLPLAACLDACAPGNASADVAAALAALYDAAGVRLTDSGTSALALAMQLALSRRPDGYCALPAFGCFDLASAALAAGIRVALYDVEPRTLAPRVDSLEPLITDACAAVVLVHHYGVPAATAEWRSLTTAVGTMLIEDAAQAAGSFAGGERTGRVGDATVLSFGRGKGVTSGAGGALLLSAALSELATGALGTLPPSAGAGRVAFVGKLFAQWTLARPAIYRVPASLPFLHLGETVFRPPTPPRAMAPAATRVLRRTLALADREAHVRRSNADRLRRVQRQVARETLIETAADAEPGWLRLPLLAHPDHVVEACRAARLGVMPTYPVGLSALAPLRPILTAGGEFPGAETLRRRLWTLPTHSALTAQDLDLLERWLREQGD